MQSKSDVHLRGSQCSVFYHDACAGSGLFSRLEHQLYRAVQLVFVFFQNLCCAQQHGCVAVMAAHVACTAARLKLKTAVLFERQCVHIRSQKDAGTAVSDLRKDSGRLFHLWESGFHKVCGQFFGQCTAACFPRDSHFGQTLLDLCTGLWQIGSDFCDLG